MIPTGKKERKFESCNREKIPFRCLIHIALLLVIKLRCIRSERERERESIKNEPPRTKKRSSQAPPPSRWTVELKNKKNKKDDRQQFDRGHIERIAAIECSQKKKVQTFEITFLVPKKKTYEYVDDDGSSRCALLVVLSFPSCSSSPLDLNRLSIILRSCFKVGLDSSLFFFRSRNGEGFCAKFLLSSLFLLLSSNFFLFFARW